VPLRGRGVCQVRYAHPKSGIFSPKSTWKNDQGLNVAIPLKYRQYLVGGKWLSPHLTPHIREMHSKLLNSERGFLLRSLSDLSSRERKMRKKGRHIQGENEFEDGRRGRADKYIEHFHKQVERYGRVCPITHIPFTTYVAHNLYDVNNQVRTSSNLSPDRIFNNINYTEQNTLFTSSLWNLTKGEKTFSELALVLKPELLERWRVIIVERFPDQEYVRGLNVSKIRQ